MAEREGKSTHYGGLGSRDGFSQITARRKMANRVGFIMSLEHSAQAEVKMN